MEKTLKYTEPENLQNEENILEAENENEVDIENELLDDYENLDEVDDEPETLGESESKVLGDVMTTYLKTVGAIPVFTPEEEIKYGKMLKYGTEEERNIAKEEFAIHNIKLVFNIAKRYKSHTLSMEDLVQEGTLGLLKAIDKYDVDTGRFSTYATWWIKQAITRSLYDSARIIRLPAHIEERMSRLRRAKRECEMNGEEYTDEDLRKHLNISQATLNTLKRWEGDAVSLNVMIGGEEDTELSEFVQSEEPDPETIYINNEMAELVDKLMECLDDRERFVIEERFGLHGKTPKTLEEIGSILKVTRERVRQIELKAMKKLKNPSRKRVIGEYSF